MEEIMFNTYQKFKTEHKDSVFKQISRLPVLTIVMMSVVFISMICGLVFSFGSTAPMLAYVCLAIELFVCIISVVYTEQYQIKNSGKQIINFRENCESLHRELCNAGLEKSEGSLKTLLMRIQLQAERLEKKIKQIQDIFWRISSLVVIPMLITLFSKWIDSANVIGDILAPTLATLSLLAVFGGVSYIVYTLFIVIEKRKIDKLRLFIIDLQGILDSQFPGGPIYSPIQCNKTAS